jgi:hypothetical protein
MHHFQANFQKAIAMLALGLGIGMNPLSAQTEPAKKSSGPAPIIQFSETKFEFGRLLAGDILNHEFTFTNAGDAELVISSVVPACGCTSLTEWTKSIPPGGTGKIPLEFNTTGMLGPVNRSVAVYSNDPSVPVSVVFVEGTVWQQVEVRPNMALIQMPPNGSQTFSTTLIITNQMDAPMKLEAPVSSVPQFRARVEEVTAGKEFNLIIDTVPPLPPGNIQGAVTIATSSKEVPELNIAVMAIAQPVVMVSPPQMFLPAVPPDVPEPYIISVSNQSPDPITVTNGSCDAPNTTVVIRETNPGKEFELVVSFPDNIEATPGKTFTISADTSSPSFPKITIPVGFAQGSASFSRGTVTTATAGFSQLDDSFRI